MKHILTFIVATALTLSAQALTREQAQPAVNSFGANPAWQHGSFSVAVYDIEADTLVAGYNPDLSCITASTMKTVTSASALQLLGANFTFNTRVYLVGQQKKNKFKGNIHVVGSGDPTLGSRYIKNNPNIIDEICAALQARGIEKVEGEITFDESIIPFPAVNGWWDVGDMAWSYGMGIHGFNFYDNCSFLKFTAHDGEVSNIRFEPAVPGVSFVNRLDKRVNDDVDLRLEEGTNTMVLMGSAGNRDYNMRLANPNPAALFADSLQRVLTTEGIKFKSKKQNLEKLKAETSLLVEHRSVRLFEIIISLLDRSDNMFTEGLLRAIAVEAGKEGTASAGAAVVDSLWRSKGIDTKPLFQHDGSGLARANKNSGRFFTQMLAFMAKNPKDGVYLSQLMPVVRKRIGKLIPKSALAENMVVKSGSMNQVQTFVGYFPAKNPRYSWAILCNNWNCSRGELRDKMDELLIALFAQEKF